MLILVFYIDNQRYAIETKSITEIVPLIQLTKLHQVPEYVAGMFNYRGAIVPVIDLSMMIQGTVSPDYFSTRIIIINFNNDKFLGLMATKVTDTMNIELNQLILPPITGEKISYLGEVINDQQGMIQYLNLPNLFTLVNH